MTNTWPGRCRQGRIPSKYALQEPLLSTVNCRLLTSLANGRRSRCLDTRSSSIGVRRTKRLSPKSLSCRVAPPTERPTRKLLPTSRSSFRNGSKPPRNSAVPSPRLAAASPSPERFSRTAPSTCPSFPLPARHFDRREKSLFSFLLQFLVSAF